MFNPDYSHRMTSGPASSLHQKSSPLPLFLHLQEKGKDKHVSSSRSVFQNQQLSVVMILSWSSYQNEEMMRPLTALERQSEWLHVCFMPDFKTKIAESNIDVLIPICVNEVAYVAEMERAENYYTKQSWLQALDSINIKYTPLSSSLSIYSHSTLLQR
jgi:hypothetical protein